MVVEFTLRPLTFQIGKSEKASTSGESSNRSEACRKESGGKKRLEEMVVETKKEYKIPT